MKNKSPKNKIIAIVGIILLVFTYVFFTNYFSYRRTAIFFEKVKQLNFSGKVIKETQLTSRVSLYKVELTASSMEKLDPRNSGEDYLFVIHNKCAELMIKSYGIKVGDSICFKGETGDFFVFRNGEYYGRQDSGTYYFDEIMKKAKNIHEL